MAIALAESAVKRHGSGPEGRSFFWEARRVLSSSACRVCVRRRTWSTVLINLRSCAELFQALRLDGESFGQERQGSGPEGRPTFWEALRVGDARGAGRDPLGGLLVGEPLPC